MMRVLSLCTGIGGIDLACEATDAMEIVGQVEQDEFCTSVLAYHWPHVHRMRDLMEVRGDEFGTVELVVAGFPCQPSSVAGKRRGAADDRWLWPEIHRVIRCARPTWCLLENVPGLITLGLDDVLSDLDGAGYETATCVYPAAAIGAPHQRERIFIVAHADCERQRQPQGRITDERRRSGDRRPNVEYASGTGQQERHPSRVACDTGHVTGRLAENRRNGQTQSSMGIATHGLPGRLAGHPGWPARPGETQYAWEAPRTVPTSDKTPQRAAQLKALGNAVVPQQVLPILQAIAATWKQETMP